MIRIIVSLLAALALPAFAQPADTILVNGKVLIGDGQFSVREAIAVRQIFAGKNRIGLGPFLFWYGPVTGPLHDPLSLLLLIQRAKQRSYRLIGLFVIGLFLKDFLIRLDSLSCFGFILWCFNAWTILSMD